MHLPSFAQIESCGTVLPPDEGGASFTSANCFAPLSYLDYYNNCTPVYMNVNVHFFVDDDCCGSVRILNAGQFDSYGVAENFIHQANAAFANNAAQWHLNVPAACVPIRYVLKGIYLHCNSDIDYYHNANTPYFVNQTSEINVFFQSTGDNSGVASVQPTYRALSMSNDLIGTFNHEMGHNFRLRHAFVGGDLGGAPCTDDTDPHLVNWDANGDGQFMDYTIQVPTANGTSSVIVREHNYFCWAHINDWPLNVDFEADKNRNGIHDCDEAATPGDAPADSPCCSWNNANNNVMGYNRYLTALTACQSQFMLYNIENETVLCNYRNTTGGNCPPAAAFISQIPLEKKGDFCTETLVLNGSFQETKYRLDIENATTQQLTYTTGWTNGEASNVKFTTDQFTGPSCILLVPETAYKATLTVENACSAQDVYSYSFKTGNCERLYVKSCPDKEIDPDGGPILGLAIHPNPGTSHADFTFDAAQGEVFQIQVKNLQSGTLSVLNAAYPATNGQNYISINISTLTTGAYQLQVFSSEKIYQGNFIKL